MKIKENIEKNYNALPGYKLVGYNKIAIPIFIRKLKLLVLTQKTIPVLEQFVLLLYNEGVDLENINKILGVDEELVEEAWVELVQKDYISNFNKNITDKGKRYLCDKEIEKLEKNEIIIDIDGLTGEVSKENLQLMKTKIVKEKGIISLKSDFNKIDLSNIKFESIKKVYKAYKRNEPDNYQGEVLDTISISGSTTKYRKVDMLFFQNSQKDFRILAYDSFGKIEEYEEKLLETKNLSKVILGNDIDDFMNSENVKNIDSIIRSCKDEGCQNIMLNNVNNILQQQLNSIQYNIVINIPLICKFEIDDEFIDKIKRLLERQVTVKCFISGTEFFNENQKKACFKLKEFEKFENFQFKQIPYYINKMIFNLDKQEVLISIYNEHEIYCCEGVKGITENFYKVKGDLYNKLHNNFISITNKQIIPRLNKDFTLDVLKNKIGEICELVNDCDSYMYNTDEVGWLDEYGIPERKRLFESPLAKNGESFRVFVDSINKSFVESLEDNAKKKGYKKYFWKDFKERYSRLQIALEKIKTYRNKSNHLKLDFSNKNRYFKCLAEDLNGYMPDFIENGYLILQEKILVQLEKAIRETMKGIR